MMDTNVIDVVAIWGLRVLYAALILGVGLWFAFFVSGLVRRQAISNRHIDTTLGTFLSLLVRYGIIVFVVIAVLQKFGVQTASLVAILGATALALALALQGTLGNVASGIIIAVMRPFRIDDFVELNGKEGTVTDIDLFFTELTTLEDRKILVPNGQALANAIVKFTVKGRHRCVIVFGIGYDDDIDKAFDILRETMAGDPRALKSPAPWFGVDGLGDFSVNVSARVWVKSTHYLNYRADMLKMVKEAFDREGVDLPYPHSVEISKGEIQLRLPPVKPPPQLAQLAAAGEPSPREPEAGPSGAGGRKGKKSGA